MCPELIINGHVYSAIPPLYRVTTKKNEYVYLRDEKALDDYKKKHYNNIQTIGREKGIGEMDVDEVEYCLVNPDTRNIVQLTVDDVEETDNMFKIFYGKAVAPRTKYLNDHLEEANID